jgi:hypothetical protein
VWKPRIAEVLRRYSPDRIRANFRLYRTRATEKHIQSPGAWLYRAIVDGYALPSPSEDASPPEDGSLPALKHKTMVSEEEMEAYVAEGVSEECFHRCLSGKQGPQFMYFDPESEGPTRRV